MGIETASAAARYLIVMVILSSVALPSTRAAFRPPDGYLTNVDSGLIPTQTATQSGQASGINRMSSKASHDIGWIGLGPTGQTMAPRLVKAGHRLSDGNAP